MPLPSPCRYPTPLPKYGDKSPCKNGVKPCSALTECWAKSGGDVVKSMNCQQEYVRDLASYLFANDKLFRSAWLEYAKVGDLPFKMRSINGLRDMPAMAAKVQQMTEDYNERLAKYNTGKNSDNDVTKEAMDLLEREIAGSNIRTLTDVPELRTSILKTLQSAFSGLFVFKKNKIDFEIPPPPAPGAPPKTCSDLKSYFTFIYNVNILLEEGRTTRTGGRKSRRGRMRKARRSTRRN